MLIDLFYIFASNRSTRYGVYKHYAAQELEELIAYYEHDLADAGEEADPEYVTRLAQTMYILKSGEYENIFWRIERRATEFAVNGQLDIYHVTNLLRAFSRS